MKTEPSLLRSRDFDLNVDACIVIKLLCVDELGWKHFDDDKHLKVAVAFARSSDLLDDLRRDAK